MLSDTFVSKLTSNRWTDEVGDGVEEVDNAQRRRQVLSPHQVRRHHRDQRHVGAVEVTVEHGEGYEEREGAEQRHKEAAEALHRHGEDVAAQAASLQTPGTRRRDVSTAGSPGTSRSQ